MKKTQIFFALALLSLSLLSACGPSADAIATGVYQTMQISSLQTQAAGVSGDQAQPVPQLATDTVPVDTVEPATIAPPATDIPLPSDTPLPSATIIGPATFSVSKETNCRYGPSASNFDVRKTIYANQSVPIVGKGAPPVEDWWVVEVEGLECWVFADVGTAAGDLLNVDTKTPPTPPSAPATPVSSYKITIHNTGNSDIVSVNIARSGGSGLGGNELGGGVIAPGNRQSFSGFSSDRTWSFSVTFQDGTVKLFSDFSVDKNMTFSISN